MTTNPANALKNAMWTLLMDKGQKANIPALKRYVYDLIQQTTQKTAGQDKYAVKGHIDWNELDMALMCITIEATALVLSGELDKITASEWTSVKDQLPEKEGDYLASHKTECGKRITGIRYFYENCPEAFTLDRTVTHWMSLPEPPEGGRL